MSNTKDISLFFDRAIIAFSHTFTYVCYEMNVNIKCNKEDILPGDEACEIRSAE